MKDKMVCRKTILYAILGVLSLLTTICMAQVSHMGITGIDLVLPCVFAVCMIVFYRAYNITFETNENKISLVKKDLVPSAVFGLVVSLSAVVGSHIDMEVRTFSSMGALDAVYEMFLFIFFFAVFRLLFFSLDTIALNNSANGVACEKQVFDRKKLLKLILINMAVMLVCWLPYYLTFFPGGIGNDNFECAQMCLGMIPWTNHHPVFYVAILNMFIKITALFGGSLTIALGIMSAFQMFLLAATLACTVAWMYTRGVVRAIRVVSLIFFASQPIMAMYSIYLTKDIMFACVLTLLVLFLMDFVPYVIKCNEAGEKLNKNYFIILGILSFFTIITRNNGTLIIAALAVALIFVFKKCWKNFLILFAIVFAINGLYKGPVWNACGIEKQSFAESASIPLSQVAYTIYSDGRIDDDSRAFLETLMPFEDVKKEFLPGYTDSYKFSDSFNKQFLDNNASKFMKVWFRLMPANFGSYVEAYLMQTSGYWKYGVTNTVATEGVQPNDLGIEGIDVINEFTGISLKHIIEELVLVDRKLPIICMFSQMAIETLAVFVVVCNYFRRKRGIYAVTVMPLLVLWLSVMIATPAHCLFRYLFPIYMMWPVILFTKADS